jgi:hypothetical protein
MSRHERQRLAGRAAGAVAAFSLWRPGPFDPATLAPSLGATNKDRDIGIPCGLGALPGLAAREGTTQAVERRVRRRLAEPVDRPVKVSSSMRRTPRRGWQCP